MLYLNWSIFLERYNQLKTLSQDLHFKYIFNLDNSILEVSLKGMYTDLQYLWIYIIRYALLESAIRPVTNLSPALSC